jgi:rubredoxin
MIQKLATKLLDPITTDRGQTPDESYEGWTCPACGLGLTQSSLKDAGGAIVRNEKRCNWCGWTPSSDPDRPPAEARERARQIAAAIEHMATRAEE